VRDRQTDGQKCYISIVLCVAVLWWRAIKCVDVTRHIYGRRIGQAIIFCSCGFYLLLSSFFLAYSQRLHSGHTWCGLSSNLECMSEMCCTRLAEIQDAKITQIRHLCTMAQLCRARPIASKPQLRHASTVGRKRIKRIKQQYLIHMSSQYGERRPTNCWNLLVSLDFGAPQQILTGFWSWLRYCTDVGQRRSTILLYTTFGRLLGWYTIIHFGAPAHATEFCHVQNSFCVQVLRSPILAALLHGSRAVGVSQTLRRGTRKGITKLSLGGRPSRSASSHSPVVY